MEDVILPTLELLEWRLRRLQFLINGDGEAEERQAQPVLARMSKLETALNNLTHQYQAIYEILKLHAKYPDLLSATRETALQSRPDSTEKLATVLTEAPSFPATASQLTSLKDLPVPPLKSFTSLVALWPRITQIEDRQVEQAQEIAELRQRSGVLLLRWHEIFVLGQGRCWAEWDTRMRKAERTVRREEIRLADDG